MRLGSALYSKLRKGYWKLPSWPDCPFVIAIQAFHDPQSLGLSENALYLYLYGKDLRNPRVENGRLVATSVDVDTHRVGPKLIPSGFFRQPEAENISAILFTNQGTVPKFTRIGYQRGYDKDLFVFRWGVAADPEPESADPALFYFAMSNSPFVETWSSGITIFHNPWAKQHLPKDAFRAVSQVWLEDGKFLSEYISEHIYSSKTHVFKGIPFPSIDPQRVVTVSTAFAESVTTVRPKPPLQVDRWFFNSSLSVSWSVAPR
jgi:hypothetical protein